MSSSRSIVLNRRTLLGIISGLASAIGADLPSLHSASASELMRPEQWEGSAVPAFGSVRRMTSAAHAFLNSLSPEQRRHATYQSLSEPARTEWSNFPAGASPRPGVSLADLTDAQRILLQGLLRASTSSQGYHKMTGAIRADDMLHEMEGDSGFFGAKNYFISLFGSPGNSQWAWMLTGHHMTAIFTVAGNRMAFTPMFTGAQPLQIPTGLHAGWQVLPQEATYAGELLASLSEAQRNVAVIGTSAPSDVIAGPGRQGSLATFQGIAAQRLSDPQQRLLWTLVQEFVRNADVESADAQLALIRRDWGNAHFSWLGPPPNPAARYYFRVHGPRILIEYDVQEPLIRNGGHIHAITRDPVNDYGADWLGQHYKEGNSLPKHDLHPPDGAPFPGGAPPPKHEQQGNR
jgi:hypothetical protein